MKIHAYKVDSFDGSRTLQDVLLQIESEPSLRERIRLINQVELRAESVSQKDGLWLMDFVRIRTSNGPGKVGRDSEVEGFEFDEEEGFGEETAALYDPASGHILVEYNHFGVRAGAIADYLSAYDGTETSLYTFKPKYDEDVERRLLNHGITRKISFCLDITRMSEQDRQRGRALSEAIDYGRQNGADKIKVEISVQGERQRSLAKKTRSTASRLFALFLDKILTPSPNWKFLAKRIKTRSLRFWILSPIDSQLSSTISFWALISGILATKDGER